MARQKKSESDWEEAERLGPYQLHEPIPFSANAQGELFRATNLESGATALVLKPSLTTGAPLRDWEVRYISSGSPNCLSMEVGASPWSFSPDQHSAEELVFLFEGLRDSVNRMGQHLPSDEPWLRRPPVLALLSAAAACAVLFVWIQLARLSPSVGPSRAAPAHMVSTDTALPITGNSLIFSLDAGTETIAHPFPRQPYKGQKRPPCNPRVEVEIMGACWVPHKLKAPCPEELYEYKGECFTTSMAPPSAPQSLGE